MRKIEHRASGGFRVDLKVALRKFSDHQLEDPWDCLLEWVRCACARRATLIKFRSTEDRRGRRFVIGFDGRALPRPQGGEPLAELLFPAEPCKGSEALAVGLLAALRLKPERITLVSGVGKARWRLELASVERSRLEPAPSKEVETQIELFAVQPVWGWERRLEERCGLSTARIVAAGRELDRRRDSDMPGMNFSRGGTRGRLEVPETPRETCRVRLHSFGVLVQELALEPTVVPFEGWVNDDSLLLNASRSAVAREDEFEGFLERLAYGAGQLVRSVAATEEKRRSAAFCLEAGERFPLRRWDAWLESAHAPLPYYGCDGRVSRLKRASKIFERALLSFVQRPKTTPKAGWERRALLAGRVTGWLWDAAGRLLAGQALDRPLDPVRRAVFEAPCFVEGASWWSFTSVKRLHGVGLRLGQVPYLVRVVDSVGGGSDEEMVRFTGGRDRAALERIFAGRLSDATSEVIKEFEETIQTAMAIRGE